VVDVDITEYISLVKYHAYRLRSQYPGDIDDMIGDGYIGLLTARDKFDQSRGVHFRTYADYKIRGAILDGIRGRCPMSRSYQDQVKRGERPSVSITHLDAIENYEEIVGGYDGGYLDEIVHTNELREILLSWIDKIPRGKIRDTMKDYYLNDNTYRQLTAHTGLAESTLSTRNSKGVAKLKELMTCSVCGARTLKQLRGMCVPCYHREYNRKHRAAKGESKMKTCSVCRNETDKLFEGKCGPCYQQDYAKNHKEDDSTPITTVTIDFSDHKHVLEHVSQEAKKELRSIHNQILWILKTHKEGVKC